MWVKSLLVDAFDNHIEFKKFTSDSVVSLLLVCSFNADKSVDFASDFDFRLH
jgi:hypothetical protein